MLSLAFEDHTDLTKVALSPRLPQPLQLVLVQASPNNIFQFLLADLL